ncbi:MAG: pyruvate kinase [Desulfuromonadaceae bacterium]|nr:pyruvate kinase [Desulfuromonadaceae bacterium]
MRRTKIVCTIGPASSSDAVLERLIRSGMNVARLNFSHGDHASHAVLIRKIREIAAKLNEPVAILQDLCGPKIRLGLLPEEGVVLRDGDQVALCASDQGVEDALPVDCPGFYDDVAVGDVIMLADGLMELRVEALEAPRVLCRVVRGGTAYRRKGVNLPHSDLKIPAFTEKDREDLRFGLEQGVDIVALSFVRRGEDLDEVRSILAAAPEPVKLIAKIEKPQAVEHFEGILQRVDGVMIARGDLGVEVPLETVPVLQKQLLARARRRGRLTITATQMLSSMVASPRPTRAEATDVANAIYDGTDALMLSDETASGAFPVEAAQTLDRIARATEPYVPATLAMEMPELDVDVSVARAIGRASGWVANDLKAAAILAYTGSGFTALCVAGFRPLCPVVALSPSARTCRQLNLVWGVRPVQVETLTTADALFVTARRWSLASGLAKNNDRIVVTAGTPLWRPGSTNLVKVIELGKGMAVRRHDEEEQQEG